MEAAVIPDLQSYSPLPRESVSCCFVNGSHTSWERRRTSACVMMLVGRAALIAGWKYIAHH